MALLFLVIGSQNLMLFRCSLKVVPGATSEAAMMRVVWKAAVRMEQRTGIRWQTVDEPKQFSPYMLPAQDRRVVTRTTSRSR